MTNGEMVLQAQQSLSEGQLASILIALFEQGARRQTVGPLITELRETKKRVSAGVN